MPQFQHSETPASPSIIVSSATYRPGLKATELGHIMFPISDAAAHEPGLPTGLLPEMGAVSAGHTPEHFLAASLASCLGLTLQLILEKRPKPLNLQETKAFVDMELSTRGIPRILRVRALCAFTSADPSHHQELLPIVRELLDRGERHCLISQALAATHPVWVSGELDGELIQSSQGLTS